jgi:phosphonate transport system substrate-binding protein
MNIGRRRALCALLASWSAGALAQEKSDGGRQLVFGLIAPRSSDELKASWGPFVEQLGSAIHFPIELRTYAEVSELTAAFVKGSVDVAWMGNVPALTVVESGAGSVFAQMVTKVGGNGYNSILVVRDDSPRRSLREVLDQASQLRFGDGDLESTSGHLIPLYFAFQKSGINSPSEVFKTVTHGSHQKNLAMVARREVDVATANTEELRIFQQEFPVLARNVRVVWESPLIPQSPLVWRTSLPTDLRRRIWQFVVNFGGSNAEQLRVLERINNLVAFRPSSNRQLLPVADIEMFRARQAIINDPSLTSAERGARIEAAIKRASRLEIMLKLSADSIR